MKRLNENEIIESYLSTFEQLGLERRPSSSLLPEDDGLMFTNSGMYQFKPYFTREKRLQGDIRGFTTCQKCVRTNDLDQVGSDGRHLSFFEMLGNFSFGTMNKEEMCETSLRFCLKTLGMDKNRLYFTVHEDDDETYDIWRKLGIEESHISRLGRDNFWSVGETGPCGPCTEIYYDQGEGFGCGQNCKPGCICDRFLEFWNIVFTSYERLENGELRELPDGGNIDTGIGLERIYSVVNNKDNVFETEGLHLLMELGETLSTDGDTESLRILSDHMRSIVFLIDDGAVPSNKERGYVIRKLIRRCVVHGTELKMPQGWQKEYISNVVDTYKTRYPDLVRKRHYIEDIVMSESKKFEKTLDKGRKMIYNKLKTDGYMSGDTVFKLYDTYGLPKEVTLEVCDLEGIRVMDEYLFDVRMEQQRQRGKQNECVMSYPTAKAMGVRAS